jgi:iron complex outermembrane receptor protein
MHSSKRFYRSTRTLALLIAIAALPSSAFAVDIQSDEIVVTAPAIKAGKPKAITQMKSSDTAALLADEPGVSLQTGGGVSSLPVVNGLADDRVLVYVDGMCLTSACANHMNPPMSYVAASSVSSIGVKAGVTPVSLGGDSIAGTIMIQTEPPLFADKGKGIVEAGTFSSYYRSNNHARGVSVSSSVAGSSLSFGVTATHDRANDYVDGHGNRITSTYYESNNLGLTLAARTDNSIWTIKAGHQSIPEQGFVNQWMDMVDNDASFANIDYKGSFGWGKLNARAYWQNTWHEMNSGKDKLTFPLMMPNMPMDTRGINIGYALKTDILVGDTGILRFGNEFHRFTLDDSWPPVQGSSTMSPNTFLNINDGCRDRYVFFAEWESKLDDQLTTVFGVRNEQVRMDTGNVQGYALPTVTNSRTYTDVNAFNGKSHTRNDSNWDITALLRFKPSSTIDYELGFARKTRSPNLYERYAWSSSWWMANGMIGWFGDGNGYVGNLDLKPEVAHTVSFSAELHDRDKQGYELKVTPYYTYVKDFISVEDIGNSTVGTRNILRFVNRDAALYGIDVSGKAALWESDGFGSGQVQGTLGYVRGKNRDTGSSLYHIMPLNLRLTLEQKIAGWTNAVELQLVDKKSNIDPVRYEPVTAGYALLNLRTAYQYKNMRVDLGVMNLFDSYYYLPLGGVNYDQALAPTGRAVSFSPLAGQGRSFNVGITQAF